MASPTRSPTPRPPPNRRSTSLKREATRASCPLEGETFRWQTDAELLRHSYADGEPYGVPDLALLQAEVDAYDEVGLFTEELPELTDVVDVDLVASVYDEDAEVIWPR